MYFSKIISLLGNWCPVIVSSTQYTFGIANRCEGGPDTFHNYGLEKMDCTFGFTCLTFFLKSCMIGKNMYTVSVKLFYLFLFQAM